MKLFQRNGMRVHTASPILSGSALRRLYALPRKLHRSVSQNDTRKRTGASSRIVQPHKRPVTAVANGEGQNGSGVSGLATLWNIVDSQFLPIALALSLTAGYTLPGLALRADAANVSKISTFVIFIISGACYLS